uniref:PH domain-containing protein n=1 Tax=Daphnia galeata TaxID=27404 RepID=A0A8J2RQ35_9CRUS|nr:unnamed protein product [Daphnia galeata]
MIADGHLVGDGSWELKVLVTDLSVERCLRVKGDLHIGGVMLRLVEELDIAADWSDHALWWPARNCWLSRTRSTLDQYGVQADALLHFTPMHKTLRVQLPDLRYLDCRVDFSVKTFNAVVTLCKELGIRHPEELSFAKPLESDDLRYNYRERESNTSHKKRSVANNSADTNTFIGHHGNSTHSSNNSLDNIKATSGCTPVLPNTTINRSPAPVPTPISSPVNSGTWRKNSPFSTPGSNGHNATPSIFDMTANNSLNTTGNSSFSNMDMSLALSPATPSQEARSKLLRPKNLIERARLNVAWLDSSLSIMEQGVREYSALLLRYKFYSFYDLNPKYDAVRINQIYEQAKWQLLNEEIDCTEEEMLMFGALQLQVNLQSAQPQPLSDTRDGDDDIDAALSDLQDTLEGTHVHSNTSDITSIPELSDYLRYMKPKRFTLKGFKRYWFVCKDLQLFAFKNRGESGSGPAHQIPLRGCEVTPDVNLSQDKFGIRLEVPGPDGMSEMWIRCDSEAQYAKWMAACRLAAKGKTMADASYDAEVSSILAFLAMQKPAPAPAINPSSLDIQPDDYVAPRFIRKLKNKVSTRILEAHTNVKDLSLTEAKLNYIKAWQSLPEYGVSLFVVKFMGQRKEELLGVAFNRLMRMEMTTGDHIKTWRYNTMKAWNVNWEVKHMMVQFEEENVIFSCLSADCKVVHEFIGGYIFLSMRSKEANQTLNEELFHKLTGGWS